MPLPFGVFKTEFSVGVLVYRTYRSIQSVYDGCHDEGQIALILLRQLQTRLRFKQRVGDVTPYRGLLFAQLLGESPLRTSIAFFQVLQFQEVLREHRLEWQSADALQSFTEVLF